MHRRSRRSTTHPLALVAVFGLVVAAVAMAGALIAASTLGGFFAERTTETPSAVVLAGVRDTAIFQAATGRFTTVVDQTTETDHIPSWLKGERVALSAEGDVEAVVDLGQLSEEDVDIAEDGSVTVHVARPHLTDPSLDLEATTVVGRERGIVDRLGGALTDGSPTDDREVQQRAVEKLREAAAQSDLLARAEENTARHLEDLLAASGVEDVTVVFDAQGPDAA